MRLIAPLLRAPRVLLFAMTCGIVSAFGQTFFIALFVPHFSKFLDVSEATFGGIYGGVTVGSALLLPIVGAKLDQWKLTTFVSFVFALVAASCALIAVAPIGALLVVGLFGVRFAGQGLCGHTWSTSIARYFTHSRGSALALASQGHPIGEGVWPAIFLAVIVAWGWRGAFGLASALCLLLFLPLVWALLFPLDTRPSAFAASEAEDPPPAKVLEAIAPKVVAAVSWTRGEVLRDWRVWILLPSWFASPFSLTGLFFHQIALAEARSFSKEGIALAFGGYAIARGAGAFLGGGLVDALGAKRVLPLILLPMATGYVTAGLFANDTAAMVYMLLAGVTLGLGGSVRGAFLAEVFGTRHLGAIRSTLGAFAVWSTALAPPIYGYAVEWGLQWDHLLLLSAALVVGATLGAVVAIGLLVRNPTPRGRRASDSA